MKDPEAYFSRKKIYGFNLQATCDQQGRFIMLMQDIPPVLMIPPPLKALHFYERRKELISSNEYILAGKAYQLDKHIIIPCKLPIASRPAYKAFNKVHSKERIRIEHAFGVLKARGIRDEPNGP
jgi:hypothetical protein